MMNQINLRSLLSFLVITVFGAAATVFIIQKAQNGINELDQINESPQVVARREFIKELLPSGTASEWRLYQSTQYGFELFYPPDYHIAERAWMPDPLFIELVIGDENGNDVVSIRAAAKNKSPLMTDRGEWIYTPCNGSELSGVDSKIDKKFHNYPARMLTGVLSGGQNDGQEASYTCIQTPKSSLVASYLQENSAAALPILDTMRFIK